MAAGDYLVDANGNYLVDDDGNFVVSNGSSDDCCCSPLVCDTSPDSDCSADEPPDQFTITISGMTENTACYPAFGGSEGRRYSFPSSPNTTFCATRSGNAWLASLPSYNYEAYGNSTCSGSPYSTSAVAVDFFLGIVSTRVVAGLGPSESMFHTSFATTRTTSDPCYATHVISNDITSPSPTNPAYGGTVTATPCCAEEGI